MNCGLRHFWNDVMQFSYLRASVCANFSFSMLTMEQKQLRLEFAQDMLDYANSDPAFLNIVTFCGETWVYGYDTENQSAVVTVETFNISDAKKSQASAEQCQSDVARFL
jgi:hypothetical protein